MPQKPLCQLESRPELALTRFPPWSRLRNGIPSRDPPDPPTTHLFKGVLDMKAFLAGFAGSRPFAGALLALLSIFCLAAPMSAQEALLERFEGKTTVHVLDNGWTFIIVERPVAPVFSFSTIVDVGSAQEVPGITGLAHMFEHMAFKGTPNIGTKDYAAEKKVLKEVEQAYQDYERERRSLEPDSEKVESLLAAFRAKQEEAAGFVVANEFGDIIEREGGVGLNAFTNTDVTGYFYSLPANKVELFSYLESERFLHPVFREFYKERDVVQEERRLRTESQPTGRLIEQAITTAFQAHPYKQPVVGYMSDLQSFTATDAEAFYRKHYVPANMVTSIVGHVKAKEVIPILETYFGRIPAGPKPEPLRTVEPPQIAEKRVVLTDKAQPFYVEMYHKPSNRHPDQEVYAAIDDILSNGRTSRLYRSLVRDKNLALFVFSFSSFPGGKYPGLWAVLSAPAKGHENAEVEAAIRQEIEKLGSEPVSAAEIERFQTRATADLVRSLDDNGGIAFQFALNQTLLGDWRETFHRLDRIRKVDEEDILRVAQKTFLPTNRTVAYIQTEVPATEDASSQSNPESASTDGATSR